MRTGQGAHLPGDGGRLTRWWRHGLIGLFPASLWAPRERHDVRRLYQSTGESLMCLTTIRAHFDGEQIRLDEPCQLEPETKLLVVVVPNQPTDGEREDWMPLSRQGLENAYGEQEPEYSLDAIKESNPDYAGR